MNTFASAWELEEKLKPFELKGEKILIMAENESQAENLKRWIQEIAEVPIGYETIQAILNSGHRLTIGHGKHALISAGRAGAELSRNLTNGVGMDSYILFYADMEDLGTHCALGSDGDLLEYTAIQNLFHEMVHAKHFMLGTFRYWDSEGQAIEEENIFRQQWAKKNGQPFRAREESFELEEVTERVGKCEDMQRKPVDDTWDD